MQNEGLNDNQTAIYDAAKLYSWENQTYWNSVSFCTCESLHCWSLLKSHSHLFSSCWFVHQISLRSLKFHFPSCAWLRLMGISENRSNLHVFSPSRRLVLFLSLARSLHFLLITICRQLAGHWSCLVCSQIPIMFMICLKLKWIIHFRF